MSLNSYLIVVDTTEERYLRTLTRGILNVHVTVAENIENAIENFLKVFRPHIIEQIKNSVYIYDLKEMITHLEGMDITVSPQLFSFLPLAGGRPLRQAPIIPPNEIQQLQQNNINRLRQTEQPVLSQEKLELIRGVGALSVQDNDGSINPRINASVGLNRNISQNMVVKSEPTENIKREHLDLLSSVGVNVHELNALYDNGITITDKIDSTQLPIAEDLANIGSEKPISEEELEQIQKQIRG